MRKAMKVVFFALFAAALASNVFAQEENQEKKIVVGAITPGVVGAIAPAGTSAFGSGGIAAIKNAPFSGEMVCECTQTLADGNRIVQRANTRVYRDGKGRIRQETSYRVRDAIRGADVEQKTIQVSDRFGGQNFTLHPQTHVAFKSATPALRDVTGVPPKDSTGVTTLQSVIIPGASNMIPFAPGNGCGQSLIAFRFALPLRAGPDTKNESLGSQMIEGVAADGFRITRDIPAGSIGNERPFEITYERWHSSELQLDVLIKSIDPRSGELTQQITNISLGEPDASLFEIPPDYTVQSFNRAQTATLGTVDRPQAATLGTVDRPQAAVLGTAASSDHQPTPQAISASLKPTIIYREKAGYTVEARQNRVEGLVVLSVVFNVNGSITDISVVRGLPDGLSEKAIEAARKIRFQPAVKDGTPVSVRGNIEFFFKLDK